MSVCCNVTARLLDHVLSAVSVSCDCEHMYITRICEYHTGVTTHICEYHQRIKEVITRICEYCKQWQSLLSHGVSLDPQAQVLVS